MPAQSLDSRDIARLTAPLAAAADGRLADTYLQRLPMQPFHTCYVAADRVRRNEARRWGDQALALLNEHAPNSSTLATALGRAVTTQTWDDLHRLLKMQPVHDLRVDFEDGYAGRSESDEDAAVDAAVAALAVAPPPSYGLRVKPLEAATAQRCARTLDRWMTGLTMYGLPAGIVTLPKIQTPQQVAVAVELLEAIEARTGLSPAALELQVETAAAIVDAEGHVAVPLLLTAGRGRVTGLHFGTYDYTAGLGLSPQEQSLDAPGADAAKDLMQMSAAGRGVAVCDGSTNRLPVGARTQVHEAWALHGRLVERAAARGLWQGWDLHPGQLISRWTTLSGFFRARLPEVQARLDGTSTGTTEEPATYRMLTAFAQRAQALGITS